LYAAVLLSTASRLVHNGAIGLSYAHLIASVTQFVCIFLLAARGYKKLKDQWVTHNGWNSINHSFLK